VNHRRSSHLERSLGIISTGLVGLVLVGCASTSSPPAAPPASHGEVLELAPIGVETLDWLTELQTSLESDPRLGAVAIDESRSAVTVTWHGEPSIALQELIARAPADLEVVLQAAAFRPGDLQKLVLRAMEPTGIPGLEIATGNVRNDGSGLEFGIVDLPQGLTEEDVAASIAELLQRPDLPITVTVSGRVVPIQG
jgi:hypothetical protein